MINRKLNSTPIVKEEVQIGNIFGFTIEQYVVVATDDYNAHLEQFGKDFIHRHSEEFEAFTVPFERLQPVRLWNAFNSIADHVFKDFSFIAHPLGVYSKEVNGYTVLVEDCFFFDEAVRLTISKEGTVVDKRFIWYGHDLQNAVQQLTGHRLLNKMGERLLFTQKAIEP